MRDVADRPMEEARPHRAVGFDDCRHPWGVAAWRHRIYQSEMCAKVMRDAAKLFRRLQDEAVFVERVDLSLQRQDFAGIERYLGLSLWGPSSRAIECGGGQIGRQKRYRTQAHIARGLDDLGQLSGILL